MAARALAIAIVAAGAAVLAGTSQTYVVRDYNFAALRTWSFVMAAPSPDDLMVLNPVWADIVGREVAASLEGRGLTSVADQPDFLVSVSAHLTDPGRGRQHRPAWPGGWPASDWWEVPASALTLVLAISDAPTNTLVWRAADTRTIDLARPEHALTGSAEALVERFYGDVKRARRLTDE